MKTILCISLIFCLTYTTAQKPIETLTGHSNLVWSVNYSPDGKYLASGSGDNSIKIWEPTTGNCIRTLTGHSSWVSSVNYSPDGKYLASGSDDNSIKIWVLVISARVRMYVEEKVTAWQQKGEYEKTTDYQLRVNEQTRQKKIASLSADALALFKEEEKNNFKIGACSIKGNYDADNESFLLDISPIGEVVIKVPLAEAPSFKQDFNNLSYKNPDFIIKDDYFVLSKLSIVNSINGKSYQWSSSEGSNYSLTNIQYNFAPIDNIKIPDSSGETGNKQNVTQTTISVGKSDVDINIPVNSTQKKTNTYALIIGNEDYTSKCAEQNKEVDVKYAANDAEVFYQYAIKTLGIPEANATLITNADKTTMLKELNKFYTNIQLTKGQGEFLLYYSGHGTPDSSGNTYILPVDQTSMDIKFGGGIGISDVYSKLADYPSKKTTVIWDACFSGYDLQISKNKSGVKINPEENNSLLKGNMVVLSSSQKTEPSQYDENKHHSVFTYYLLKKLQDSKGDVNLSDLEDYLKKEVPLHLNSIYKPLQHPKIKGADDNWKSWKL